MFTVQDMSDAQMTTVAQLTDQAIAEGMTMLPARWNDANEDPEFRAIIAEEPDVARAFGNGLIVFVAIADDAIECDDPSCDHALYVTVRSDGATTAPVPAGTFIEMLMGLPEVARWENARAFN